MGAGKTTIGRDLANSMNFKFIDLDEYIEKKENSTVFDIFNKKGEKHFRQLEHYSLKELILLNNIVIATGGGTPCFFDNHNFMKSIGNTIYLKVSPEELYKRLQKTNNRPLLFNNKLNLNQFIQDNLMSRVSCYSESNFTLDSDNILAEELSDLIRKIKYEENTY